MAQPDYAFDYPPDEAYTQVEIECLDRVDRNARNFISPRTRTLDELFQHVAENAGDEFFEINDCMAQGEVRSVIRNVCRYVAEYQDGTEVDLMSGNYHRVVQPAGTMFATLEIQRIFRGFLGRRVARERRYQPNAPGYERAREDFESHL